MFGRRRGWRAYEGRDVLINLINGDALKGRLESARGPITLTHASIVGEQHKPVRPPCAIDGQIVFEIELVTWAQVIEPAVTVLSIAAPPPPAAETLPLLAEQLGDPRSFPPVPVPSSAAPDYPPTRPGMKAN